MKYSTKRTSKAIVINADNENKKSISLRNNDRNLRENIDKYSKFYFQNLNSEQAALELYDLGFNVLPINYGSKKPIGDWKILQTTRLYQSHIRGLFKGMNVGVLTGRTSMNLFIIDVDEYKLFNEKIEELESLELAKWVVSTSRGGHIWFLSKDGEVDNYSKRDFQVMGQNRYVLAPPSENKETGVTYYWKNREGELPPNLSVKEINNIFPYLTVYITSKEGLPPTAYRVLVEKDITRYESNSEAEAGAVWSFVRAGWDDKSIIQEFEKFKPPHYFGKNLSRSYWLKKFVIAPAREMISTDRDNKKIENAIDWVYDKKWPGISGSTDRLVLLACIQRAKIEGISCFRATYRELSEMTNISRRTIKMSIDRLTERRYIERIPKITYSSHFKITDKILNYSINTSILCKVNGEHMNLLRKHDAFHFSALGRTALEVYETLLLSNMPLNEKEISDRIGKGKKAIENACKKLLEEELIGKSEEETYLANKTTDEELNAIAKKYGTLGKSAKKKEQHSKERQSYAFHKLTKNFRRRITTNSDNNKK